MARILALGSLGVTVALGASLVAPHTSAQASAGVSCPAASLTEAQLGHLIVDVNAATAAKAAAGYRVIEDLGVDDQPAVRTVTTKDDANDRFNLSLELVDDTGGGINRTSAAVMRAVDRGASTAASHDGAGRTVAAGVTNALTAAGLSGGLEAALSKAAASADSESIALHIRRLGDGHLYLLVTRAHAEERAPLALLNRRNGWVDMGTESFGLFSAQPPALALIRGGAECVAAPAGLTITAAGDDDEGLTFTTDGTLALVSSRQRTMGWMTTTTTTSYGQYTVPDILAAKKIKATDWGKANMSADQRASMKAWAREIRATARAAAGAARRVVTATDLRKAAKHTPVRGASLAHVKGGVMASSRTTDPFEHQRLRIKIRAVKKAVKLSVNW